jgi:hypothetical protein
MDWEEVKEPLTDECFVPTNKGHQIIHLKEPTEEDIAHIQGAYPFPKRPIKKEHIPVEYPDGRQVLEIKEVPETDEKILTKWQDEFKKVEEKRWLAFAEASVISGDKPPGNTPMERTDFLNKLPLMVKSKLIATAKNLSEKRLVEEYEEAKKD